MHVYFYMYLLKRPHGHRVMLQRLCRCILGSEVKLAVSEVLNLVHSFEPKLQEQHLSPSAFHTLITAMFSLISLPLWKLFLWGGLSVRGQARGRPKACHWYNVELKTVGFVLTSLLPLSVLHLTQFISHTLDFFFVTVVLSGDCSVFAQTGKSAERLHECSECIAKRGWLYACVHTVWACWRSEDDISLRDLLDVPGWVSVSASAGNLGLIMCEQRKSSGLVIKDNKSIFLHYIFSHFFVPRQQWEGDGLHTSKSVKTMYLLQWMVLNLSSQHPLVRLSFSFLSVPLSSWLHASFLFLSPFFSPYNPLFVWSNLWGLSGILASGKVIYSPAPTVLAGCDIPHCLHVLPANQPVCFSSTEVNSSLLSN